MLSPLQYLPEMDGISHGFFTRDGGVSTGLYGSLNCRLASQDDPDNIRQNRERVASHLGTDSAHFLTLQQVHSNTALVVSEPWPDSSLPKADALVTNTPGLAIGALTADCGPVLFADPVARVIGAAHAGWRGAASGILESTLDKMMGIGASLDNIHVALGPTISQKNYEVSQAFRHDILGRDTGNDQFFNKSDKTGNPHFNLPGYIEKRLTRAGVNHLFISTECTYDNESHYYSFRFCTHNGMTDYGCQVSAIMVL